jgi:hypothetical protein
LHRPVDLRHLGVGVSEYGVEYEEVLLVDVGLEGGLHQALQLSRAEGLDNGHQGVRVAAVQSCKITNNESRPAGFDSRPFFLKPYPEPIFVGLLRSPRIDFQPGRLV